MADKYLGGLNPIGSMLNNESVTYNTTDLDPGTSDLINNNVRNATQSSDQIAGKLNQGIEDAGQGAMNVGQNTSANLNPNPAIRDAIINKYKQVANRQMQSIQDQNTRNAPLEQSSWLTQAYQHAMAQQAVTMKNYSMLNQAFMDSAKARSQVISSVFNVAGAAGADSIDYARRGADSENYNNPRSRNYRGNNPIIEE